MYAEPALLQNALSDVVTKKATVPAKKTEVVQFMTAEHGSSSRQAYQVIQMTRSLLLLPS